MKKSHSSDRERKTKAADEEEEESTDELGKEGGREIRVPMVIVIVIVITAKN